MGLIELKQDEGLNHFENISKASDLPLGSPQSSTTTISSSSSDVVCNPPEPFVNEDSGDISNYSEGDLRKIFSIIKKDHPAVLYKALSAIHVHNNVQSQEAKSNLMKKFDRLTHKKGCYLFYDASSAKLKLLYSSDPVKNAIGFYTSRTIPEFKFRKNFGRADLIGNCASGIAGRKNFYSGVCQFIRAARSTISAEERTFTQSCGELWMFPKEEGQQGLDVDIYVYDAMAEIQTVLLELNKPLQNEVLECDAVACLPKHADTFQEVRKMELNRWLVRANSVGANIRFDASAGPESLKPNEQISLVDKITVSSIRVDKDEEMGGIPEPPHAPKKGCYLIYDANCCKLKLKYSDEAVRNAIGFYCAGIGYSIRNFKFTKNFGRADLIGNCASGATGRKNYYSGWCQFIRAARALDGSLWIYPRQPTQPGLDVDIYLYFKDPEEVSVGIDLDRRNSIKVEEGVEINALGAASAVACLPRHADFFSEVKTMDLNRWMTEGSNTGASSRFD